MLDKTTAIVEKLEGFSKKQISEEVIFTILKTQALVREINADGNND
jgi:hypothetical protein